jgi:high-affinity iron transporter
VRDWTTLCGVALAALLLGAAPAQAEVAPWRAAEGVRDALFDAQTELILGTPQSAERKVQRARAAYRGELRRRIRREAPEADAVLRRALRAAEKAAAGRDARALASARGQARGAVFQGAITVTVDAAKRGDAQTARAWLLIREFRTATRFTRPGANATLALDRLAAHRMSGEAASQAVAKDLLDAYQARMRELLGGADRAAERGLKVRWAEAAAQGAAYWPILAARYTADRGQPAAETAARAFGDVAEAARSADAKAYGAARRDVDGAVAGFTAAPLTGDEAARRAQQLLRFLALVPVEYGRGVKGDRVTLDFEVQEAIAFRTGAAAAFADLQSVLAKRNPARTTQAGADIERLRAALQQAIDKRQGVMRADDLKAIATRTEDGLKASMPKAWLETTDESDYDLIALTLDRMEAAVGAGQYRQAEQARIEAYAFFEFGPERRLRAFDPGLAVDIEGLIWYGAKEQKGLATLIAKRAQRREIHTTRQELDTQLADAAATLGDSANKATVVTNAAILVFREGLEAVLILAAITASFVGARRHLRRPVLIGAVGGLFVSAVTFVLAQTLLRSLQHYGEKLEAVVGLIAIAVLLLVMNWFFHKVYWSEWIARFHRQRRKLLEDPRTGFFSAQVLGLVLLGLTSVYREGFETVLFLQTLQLSAGTVTVLEGVALGLAFTLAVAVVTFVLQHKLPYKKMLIVTGLLIALVLVVMVGQTTRTMQGTGWLPITPAPISVPYWAGLWLGVYPTWETIGAQIAAFVFVIGSYYLAQEVRVRGPQRRARARTDTAAATNGSGLQPPAADPAPDREPVRSN